MMSKTCTSTASKRPHHSSEQWHRGLTLIIAIVVAVLAGCTTPSLSNGIHATQTASAMQATATHSTSATVVASPILVDISVQQSGTVAQHSVKLDLAITVRNQTLSTLHIWYICGFDPFVVQVLPINSQQSIVVQNTYSCAPMPTIDVSPAILAGTSHTYNVTTDLSDKGGALIQEPQVAQYVVRVSFNWRPGLVGQESLPGGRDEKASGETTITLH